ncbi:MAG TPA: M1 family metallopeptidase [Bacteroidales bacterium]|nr:M1 family metallopeptidase [Bacteroidales bacterium]HRZ48882.1 M1 family metallopeptidase [Bacteroidales bacterium]
MKYLRLYITGLFALIAGYAGSQTLKSDTVDVLNYTIRLDMRHLSTQQIYGNTEILLVPRMAQVISFSLDFRKLTIDSIFLNHQVFSNFTYNDTVLGILLPAAATPSDTLTLRVVYHGTPLIEPYNWGGFHFLPDSTMAYNLGVAFQDYPHNYGRIWFPCLDDFTDRATYDVIVRTKGSHKAVCGGYLADTLQFSDGSIAWHWKLEQPIPTYLASVAVGEFSLIPGSINGIQGPIPVTIFVKPQDSVKAIGSFSNLGYMVGIFENRFGPYRWPRIGYTGTTKGAMEHATNIALPRNLITGNNSYDWLIAHELSHHWFGNLMTCSSAEDMWINEGWARYCEAIFSEGISGWDSYKSYIMGLQKDVLNYAHTNSSGGDGSFFPLYPVPQTHTYGTTVYDKGALVAHSLRGYLGDSLFFSGIKALLSQFAFMPASSYQIRDFLSQQTGKNLNPFFDGWVFTPGFPHFSIDSIRSIAAGNQWNVTVYARQKMFGRSVLTQDNTVEIGFYQDRNNWQIHRMNFSGQLGQTTFVLPFNPVLVLMDPEDRLSDAITAETAKITTTGTLQFPNEFFRLKVDSLPDTLLVRIEHSFVPPDPLPQPVAGLTLSPNRYWKISGIIPSGTSLEGLFTYSTGNQFDNALITNTQDSLVILYRNSPGDVWSGVAFSRTPSPTAGTITVPDFQPGEYVLARWDKNHIGIVQPLPDVRLNIYPNPVCNELIIYSPERFHVTTELISPEGKIVFSMQHLLEEGEQKIRLPGDLPFSHYVLRISETNGSWVHSEKITVCP